MGGREPSLRPPLARPWKRPSATAFLHIAARCPSHVDRTEATRRFCRDHIGVLSGPTSTPEIVRRMRIDWAAKRSLHPSERFSNLDVARELCEIYLKMHAVSEDEFAKAMRSIPFVAAELKTEDLASIYRLVQKPTEGIIRPADLGKLDQQAYVETVIEKLKAQAGSRAQAELAEERAEVEELRREVEAERAELQQFRSDLDAIPTGTGVEDLARGLSPRSEVGPGRELGPWWKEIGLTGNPFPTYTGLDEIPAEKYDDILVQTPFFRHHVELANNDPGSLLGKTILVSGEFGSGKTTLFQYLASTLGRQGIVPVEVDFVTYDQTESLIRELAARICDSLAGLCVSRFGEDPRRDALVTDPIAFCGDLFERLQDKEKHTAFLVCVDGLHKGSVETRSIFTFLQQIQNLQENLSHRGVRVGFLVAGSPRWDQAIEQSPSLSGSFHRRDIIPPLDEESAVQSVERRIGAFASNSALTPSINQADLRRAFQILSQRIQRPLAFRDFLKDIGNRLETRAFADAGITVALHFETVEAVQTILGQSETGRAVRKLLAELETSEGLQEATREVLLTLLEKGGVSEQGDVYRQLRPAFFLLRRHSLIKQRRSSEGSFEWTLAPDLKSLIADIAQRLSISPKNTLRACLEEVSTARRAESGMVYKAAKLALGSLLPAWKDQWPRLVEPLQACLTMLEETDELTRTANWRSVSQHFFTESVTHLVYATDLVALGEGVTLDNAWTLYKDSWFAPENLDRISVFAPGKVRSPDNETNFFGLLHDHNDVVTQLVRELREFLQGEAVCRLSGRQLSHEELLALRKLRRDFSTFGYNQVVGGVADILESHIRRNCHVVLRMAWGDSAFDRLPTDVRAAIERVPERGHPRTRRERDANFFYDMTRSEYSKVLFEGNLSRCLFGSGLDSNDRSKLKDSIELTFSLDDRRSHRDHAIYFKEHATEIGASLGAIPWVLEALHRMTMRILQGGELVATQLSDDGLDGTFFGSDKLNPPPKMIRVPALDASSLRSLYLRRCAAAPFVIQDAVSLCLSSTAFPEAQVLALRSLLADGSLTLTLEPRSAPTLTISPKGDEGLATPRAP
jgi:hypothetical protein